ncbi:hypothetical protein FQP85_22155 [Pseudoalteromonas neustonica]|uniref:Morphogenetic protein n=1 Tax=Pseudoalteromonas neustonica TaxID=1840331 RepID=A0ABY3F7G8_9GAMM|nr:hypothetical protein [Pseudoalteromonas neustonica]TVU79897.1 hypothetical protein FQP85_22155 [Pseudoalteromonas neustonica]
MKTIPMIFNQEMVQALVDGRKTVTRRPVEAWRLPVKCTYQDESRPAERTYMSNANNHRRWGFGVFGETPEAAMENYNGEYSSCAPYNKGDLIWVRETLEINCYLDAFYLVDNEVLDLENRDWQYREPEYIGKIPSIHMPRWASRLTLRVTNVRCERIHQMTKMDAIDEGFDLSNLLGFPRLWFRDVWNSLYSNWDENPWVWVIEFEVIKSNVDEVTK